MSTITRECVKVIASRDRMEAWIQPIDGADISALNAQALNVALEAAEVAIDDVVIARIKDLLDRVAKTHRLPKGKFVIAEGRLPIEGSDGGFVVDAALVGSELGDPAKITWFQSARPVEAGAILGKLTPPTPGQCGADVSGNALPCRCKGRPIALGEGVRTAEDGVTVVASATGLLMFDGVSVVVRPMPVMDGDIGVEPTPRDIQTDACIKGAVLAGATVRCAGSLTVSGVVESARIEAKGSVYVHGGIVGGGRGHITAGGGVHGLFCEDATLEAGGDVVIARELLNARVEAVRVRATGGGIVGGSTYARHCIQAETLGSDAFPATFVRVGASEAQLCRINEIENDIKVRGQAAAQIRQNVQPLVANLKRLNPKQREQATELMFKADSLDAEVQALRDEQKAAQGGESNEAFVEVRGTVFPGVTIAIGDREVRFERAYAGPVRIERQKIKGVTEIVACRPGESDGCVLKSHQLATGSAAVNG